MSPRPAAAAEKRCTKIKLDGTRCILPLSQYGTGKLCGIHYHAERKKKVKP